MKVTDSPVNRSADRTLALPNGEPSEVDAMDAKDDKRGSLSPERTYVMVLSADDRASISEKG